MAKPEMLATRTITRIDGGPGGRHCIKIQRRLAELEEQVSRLSNR